MRQVVMHAPGDVRVEDREDPTIIEPTDAIIRLSATCICGSDLWPYRGAEPVEHQVMGHEYVGVVEEVGDEVRTIKVGDFVVGLLLGLRQHLRDLPGRLPGLLRAPRADGHHRHPVRAGPHPARRRHPRRHARHARRPT